MKCNVVFLQQAKADLKAIKNYIVNNFSRNTWELSYTKIKDSVNSLKIFPQAGSVPPELENLGMNQYRQIIAGMNRIIYEIRQETVYIHIVCDTRRDMKGMLTTRLLSTMKSK